MADRCRVTDDGLSRRQCPLFSAVTRLQELKKHLSCGTAPRERIRADRRQRGVDMGRQLRVFECNDGQVRRDPQPCLPRGYHTSDRHRIVGVEDRRGPLTARQRSVESVECHCRHAETLKNADPGVLVANAAMAATIVMLSNRCFGLLMVFILIGRRAARGDGLALF